MDKVATHAAGQGRALSRAPGASGGATGMGRLPAHSLPRSRRKPHSPVRCTEGGVRGRLCGSLLSSSLFLSQAFQKPLDTVFFPSTPTPKSLREYAVERMWSWKSGGQSHSHTSAHFLVGSSPDSSEGHFARLWNKAAGLDLDDPECSRQP